MQGTAKRFVDCNKHLKDWMSLKSALMSEFKNKINCAHMIWREIREIIDDERNKVVLYGANTIDELKARIETYERLKMAMKDAKNPTHSAAELHERIIRRIARTKHQISLSTKPVTVLQQ